MKDKKSIFAVILEGDKHDVKAIQDWQWREWIHCTEKPDDDTLRNMILNKWLRDRGGLGEVKSLTVTIYTRDKMTFPCTVFQLTLKLTPNEKAA